MVEQDGVRLNNGKVEFRYVGLRVVYISIFEGGEYRNEKGCYRNDFQ